MRRFSKAVTSLVVVITLIIGLVAVGKSNVRAAGVTPEFLGEVVAREGDASIMDEYTPTQIINGNFDSHPNLYPYTVEEVYKKLNIKYDTKLYINESGTITTGSAVGADVKSIIESIERSDGTRRIIENWKTSETSDTDNGRIVSRFEWLNSYYLVNSGNTNWPNNDAYGKNITFKIKNDTEIEGCVELNQENQGTLYQDLGTTSRDVIMWSLEHAARKIPSTQEMRVIIGAPKKVGDANKAPADAKSGDVEVSEASIRNPTVFNGSGVATDAGFSKDGYAKVGGTKWLSFTSVPSEGVDWKKAEGIYIVPDSQALTRFAFQSTGGGTRGNFLDDVVFDTLAGNLKTSVDSNGDIVITGYWGDLPDASDELIYEIYGDNPDDPIGTVLLNMKNVQEGPFEATITKQKLTDGGLTDDQIKEIQKSENLEKNDVIPKDYYSQVNVGAKIPYKVNFDTQKTGFDNPDIQFKSANGDEKASSPSEYVKDQLYVGSDGKIYKFKGWYEDKAATTPYDFDSSVIKDITLYAGWETVTDAALVFDSNGKFDATGIPGIQTSEGASNWTGTKPATDPSLLGFIFDGWYESANPSSTDKPYNFTSAIPSGTVKTLYAKWTPVKPTPPSGGGGYVPSATIPTKTHKVEFETPVGPKPNTQSGIKSGQTAKDPTSFKIGDEIDGQIFEGWFKDPEFKVPYDFNEKVNEDIKVYAKWTAKETSTQIPTPEQKEVKIEFESEIGVTPETQVTTPGNTATDPGAPMNPETLKPGMIINGYRFEGWYLDKDFTIPYNFGMAVNEDIVLYAKWAAVGIAKSPKTSDATAYYWMALAAAGLITFFGRTALRSKKSK